MSPLVIPSGTEYTRVGKIFVSNIILGYGSHGTMVYAGMLEGRSVAVKRMLVHFFEIAHSEISLLMQSDEHSHVIRYFAKVCETSDDLCNELGRNKMTSLFIWLWNYALRHYQMLLHFKNEPTLVVIVQQDQHLRLLTNSRQM